MLALTSTCYAFFQYYVTTLTCTEDILVDLEPTLMTLMNLQHHCYWCHLPTDRGHMCASKHTLYKPCSNTLN